MPTTNTQPLRTCTRCGAPEGERITRFNKEPIRWTSDLSFHFNHSDVWRKPSKVVITRDGRCAWCAHPFRIKYMLLAIPLGGPNA